MKKRFTVDASKKDILGGTIFTTSNTDKWITIKAAEDTELEDPRIDEVDELQERVEDDFSYVMTGIERLGREGMLDEAINLLHTLADTLDSAINIIGNDFKNDKGE